MDGEAQRLDQFLSIKTGRSRSFVQYQIEHGRITVNGEVIDKSAFKIRTDDEVAGVLQEDTRVDLEPIEKPLDILYEDDDLLCMNKPQGWIVHPAAGHSGETVVHYLLHYLNKDREFRETDPLRPGIVHRLDRGTSGVLLIAKNRRTLEGLALAFKEREMEKEYEAIVWGRPNPKGMIKTLVGRHPVDRKKMSTKVEIGQGREAETSWMIHKTFAHASHVNLFPKTGRTHQLRVQMASINFPIVSDELYCGRRGKGLPLLPELKSFLADIKHPFLHAKSLSFIHPKTKEPISVKAPRPPAFETALKLFEAYDR